MSREIVLDRAGAMADRAGWQQVTMSSLARDLRVQGPSLHHHVGTVESLRADVQVRALADLSNRLQRAAMGKVGPECFRALAEQLRAYAAEHPGLYELSQSSPLDLERAARASEPSRAALIAVIESFGIPDPCPDLLLLCLAPLHGVLALSLSGAISSKHQQNAVYQRATELVIMLLEQEGKV